MTKEEARHISSGEYIVCFFQSLREIYKDQCDTLGRDEAWKGYQRCIDRLVDDYTSAAIEGYISHTDFRDLMQTIDKEKKSTYEHIKHYGEDAELIASIGSDITTRGCKGREAAEYEREYQLGCLLTPDNLTELPMLSLRASFVAPDTIDLRDYCIATRDQGRLPWCAAFAATGFASNIIWRKEDYPVLFDNEQVYRHAKSIDGCPKVDGTSLVAVLQSLLDLRIFNNPTICEVKTLRTVLQVKYAIHKFGCCLVGVNVSKEWYACNKNKSTISGRKDTSLLGGHAILACGYNNDGIIIQNSWGADWGSYGFALITWKEFEREFVYGAVIDNCLYDTKMN